MNKTQQQKQPRSSPPRIDPQSCLNLVVYIFAAFGILEVILAAVGVAFTMARPERVVVLVEKAAGIETPTLLPTYTPLPTSTPCPICTAQSTWACPSVSVETPEVQTNTPYPTYTVYPTYTPYPTLTPVMGTRGPLIITPTPSDEEQDPPPGSIIPAGSGYALRGILLATDPKVIVGKSSIGVFIIVTSDREQNYIMRFRGNVFHLRDDTGKEYVLHYTEPGYDREVFQVSVTREYRSFINLGFDDVVSSGSTYIGYFEGPISLNAQYLIFTVDELAGMTNLSWQYNLQ